MSRFGHAAGARRRGAEPSPGRARERRLPPRDLHARQRHGGGGGREPPRARSWRTGSGTRSAPPTARPASPGLPHFLEHLMFKGTGEIPPGEFSKIVARLGGNDNAMTSYDSTAYFQMIAKDRLELVMAMEADRMVNLDLVRRPRLSRARRHPGGAPLPRRQRAVGTAGRAADGRAVPAPPLPAAGDRLVPRDRGLHPRGRARVLPRVVRAQQRRPGGRRRRHRGRAAPAGRAEPTARSPPATCRRAGAWPSRRSMPSAASPCTTSGCASRA